MFISTGTGSNSFAGSLNLAKGLNANSYQGAGLTNCDNTTGKIVWNNGQFSCQTDQTGGAGGVAWQAGLAAGQITFYKDASTASGSAKLSWDSTNKRLGINSGAAVDTTFEVGGAASISGAITQTTTASNSFAGSLNTALGLHATGNVTTLAQLFSTGTGSNSFAGSLNLSKGLTANSYQGGGLQNCDAVTGKLTWDAGQFGCGTDAGGGGGISFQSGMIAGQLAFFKDSSTASGSTKLAWDNTSKSFGINAGNLIDTTLEVGGTASISGTLKLASLNVAGCLKNDASGVVSTGSCGDAREDVYTSNSTYTYNSDAQVIIVAAIGAGGGGGGGASANTAINRAGGGGGGGAAWATKTFTAGSGNDIAANVSVSVPAGGAAGAGVNNAAGTNGTAGGNATFGAFLTAYGGGYGRGGNIGAVARGTGGGGGGGAAAGSNPTATAGGAGGGPLGGATNGANAAGSYGGGAGGATTGNNGGSATWGGGGGGGAGLNAAGGNGGGSYMGAGGGGGGGSKNNAGAGAGVLGGAGGKANAITPGGGGTAGAANSGAGGIGANSNNAAGLGFIGGQGGGGGGAANSTAGALGGNGGNGGIPGGGGGGGGITTASAGVGNGGAGGNGARGEVRVWTVRGAGGADLAEIYYTNDPLIQATDVVSIDPSIEAGVKMSVKPYDPNLLGVISTKPNMVMGGDISSSAAKAVPLALTGRVPVKVTIANGAIKPGDYITSSNVPGMGMKATKAGPVIGIALTGYDGGGPMGIVVVFVKQGYFNGESIDSIAESFTSLIENRPSNKLVLDSMMSGNSLMASESYSDLIVDRIAAGVEIITPHILSDSLSVNSIDAVNNDIKLLLGDTGKFIIGGNASSSYGGFGNTASGSSPFISFDNLGNGFFSGELIAGKISAREIVGLDNMSSTIASLSSQYSGLLSRASMGDLTIQNSLSANLFTASGSAEFGSGVSVLGGLSVIGSSSFGTLTAGTIFSNDIRGSQFTSIESRLASLSFGFDRLASVSINTDNRFSALASSQLSENSLLSIGGLSVNGATTLRGSLVVNTIGSSEDAMSIISDVWFVGRPYFNADTAGFAMVKEGAESVDVVFDKDYLEQPIVNANISIEASDSLTADTILNSNIKYVVTNKSTKGFTIKLNGASPGDLRFSWIAFAVRSAKVFNSKALVTSTPTPEATPEVTPTPSDLPTPTPEATPEVTPTPSDLPTPTPEATPEVTPTP